MGIYGLTHSLYHPGGVLQNIAQMGWADNVFRQCAGEKDGERCTCNVLIHTASSPFQS